MNREQADKDFLKFWKHISLGTKDETLIVLKGHLLLEDLMREYCGSKVRTPKSLEDAKLSYVQILNLTRSFVEYPPDEWVIGAMRKINSLRNKLAHNLEPVNYSEIRDEFVSFVKGNAGDNSIYSSFSKAYEQLGVSIFLVYSTLSFSLRFKPKTVLQLLAEEYKDGQTL